jgi:hypothetical protein
MKNQLTVLFLLFSKFIFSQNYADSLNVLYKNMVVEKEDSIKEKISTQIINLLGELIEQKNVNQNFADSLKGLSVLVSENQKVIVVTFEIVNKNNLLVYKGAVFNKINKTWQKNTLQDTGIKGKKLESFISTPENWLGCRYYKIITLKEKGRQSYALLASNLSDKTISRKWIDVLVIDEKYEIFFGDNIFEAMPIKRHVLQYNSNVVASLKYNEKRQQIIFDHLIPTRADLKNQFQFYSPDLSFDAYQIKNAKLKFLKDIDARNPER